MGIGDVYEVEAATDCYYVDTGMYDTPQYGAVYILDTERPAIVDTGIGTNYERILDALETVGIAPSNLETIAATHVHLDHAGGAGFLAAETDADVYVHESGATFLADPGGLWAGTKQAVGKQIEFYTEPKPVPVDRIEPIHDGATLDLGNVELDVHHAPGHAFHQVIFHDVADDVVYAADAAGIYVPQRDAIRETSPPPDFDIEGVIADARLISRLDPDTICYAHFGPEPADERVSEYVSVITDWVEGVAEKRDELGDDNAVIEHFVEAADIDEVWGAKKADPEVAMNVRGVLQYLDERAESPQ
ncbi:MAG: glyoxylase-like metal-dependent hydrolase (beta-lactamase superfamily II) [Natronomonas sp.]|jgi:glyoxylase-like metal-dependent hydrolase (beta-lactamase superfamily II)|uniref:MBL fold metallo-hydrolase n=1 Tax=Natronomonas sp. TaxID=2184060 RepID=UPI0039896AAF